MTATFAGFKERYPELVTPSDGNQAQIEALIDDFYLLFGEPPCTKIADQLAYAWVAHNLAKSSGSPDGGDFSIGTPSSKSVGSVSISYNVAQTKGDGYLNDWYKSTPYGNQYLMYLKYCYATGVRTAP